MLMEMVYVSGGVLTTLMADAIGLEVSPVFSDVGVVKFNYPKQSATASLIAPGNEFAITIDGTEVPDLRFILEETGIDEAAEDGQWDCQARTILSWFENGIVYPPNWPTATPPFASYTNATAGKIIKDFWTAAQARGALTNLTTSTFNNIFDSVPAGWSKQVTLNYDAGVTILSVIQNLVQQNACEVKMVGRDLKMYNPNAMGVDLTVTHPEWVLRLGREAKDSPRKTSTAELATALLVKGAGDVFRERTDAGAIATYGRRETYATQDGISDTGTLDAYGDAVLGTRKQPKVEKTIGLVFGEQGGPEPFVNFNVGDWIYIDTTGTLERMRIKQWTLKQEEDGTLSGSVTLNDLFSDTVEKLLVTIDGITGATANGTSATGNTTDYTIPVAPVAPSFSSAVFNDASGNVWAQITATWTAITGNTDGSAITDLDHYELQYGLGASPTAWTTIYKGTDTTAYFSPLKAGIAIGLRVGAWDKAGHFSGWSPTYTNTTATDSTAPATPSTPTGTSRLGVLEIAWDGLGSLGEAMPSDFAYCEVHVSTTTGFTPSNATLNGVLYGKGKYNVANLTYGTTYYAKLINVDRMGNRSAASAQTAATIVALVNTDVIGRVIDGAKIILGSVTASDVIIANSITTALMAANSISGDRIQANTLAADKIAAGTLSAALILSGSIKTAASGARVEMDAAGIRIYNASIQTAQLKNDGTVWFRGGMTLYSPLSGTLGAASGDLIGINYTTGGTVDSLLKFTKGTATVMSIDGTGTLHLNTTTTPISLTPGTLSGSPLSGDIEFDGQALYISTGLSSATGPIATFTPPSSSSVTHTGTIPTNRASVEDTSTSVTGGTGSGAQFAVLFYNRFYLDGPDTAGSYGSVRMTNPGTGYTAGDVLTVNGPWTGGSISVTVNTTAAATVTRKQVLQQDAYKIYTPSIGGTGWTVSTASGRYLRIGNMVHCEITMHGLGTGGTAGMTISLPIQASGSALQAPIYGVLTIGTFYDLRGRITAGATTMLVYVLSVAYNRGAWLSFTNANSPAALGGTGGTDEVLFSFTYEV